MIVFELLNNADWDGVNKLYNEAYSAFRTRAQSDWEFVKGPAGPAIYVVARDTETGKIIGTQCAIPLYLKTSDGSEILSAKSEDTLVDAAYRGRQIFEKMYDLLFEKCREAGINYLWGFTYAAKPFRKLGFEIPFQTNMGILAFDLLKTIRYLQSLNAKNSFAAKLKIISLVAASRINSFARSIGSSLSTDMKIEEGPSGDLSVLLNGQLVGGAYFGLNQDSRFLHWRLYENPYPHQSPEFSLKGPGGQLLAHCACTISKEGVCYLTQLLFAKELDDQSRRAFITKVTSLLQPRCFVIRYWGFEHNPPGSYDVQVLKRIGFIFIGRGISFVWKFLGTDNPLNPNNMLLSRMAAQGTS